MTEKDAKLIEAIEIVCQALREDKDYYRAWKDNIAMVFKDEAESKGVHSPNMENSYLPSETELKMLKQVTMLSTQAILKYFKNDNGLHKNQIINRILNENKPKIIKL